MCANHYLPEGLLFDTRANREALATPATIEHAMAQGMILEAPATLCDSDLTLHVDLGCMRGYIPREEALWCREGEAIKDIAILTRVGKHVCFIVTGFRTIEGERVAMLSRRAAQAQCMTHFFDTAREGDLIEARVTHLEPYGAFVDIGCGVCSLLCIDCISVSRITHPRERLSTGMYLWVAIKTIDRETGRVFVTLKELLGTWEENAAAFRVGETVTGRVRSIESYGIFVELAPNLAGLAELRGSGNELIEAHVGDLAAVYVKSILPERMKVKLVIIDAYASPEVPRVPRYFVDTKTVAHLSHWVYSPPLCERRIETIFA